MIEDKDATLVKDIIRVFIFEHWARFYYSVEHEGKVYLEVPAEVMEKIGREDPDLSPLLVDTNLKELTYESCQMSVGTFVCTLLDGAKYAPGVVTKAMDSKDFRIELHLFNLWVQGHESYLEQHDLSFADWLEMFANWKLMDKVQEFIAKLRLSPAKDPSSPGSTSH